MDFATLALITAVGILGPLLALPQRWRLPILLGELLAGIALGRSGLEAINPQEPTFNFLATIGFALVMFVAGTHVPVRDPRLRPGIRIGAIRMVAVAALAAAAAVPIASGFHTGHAYLYAVLLASSSAAIVLPLVQSLGLEGARILQLLAQVAIADALCVVALPLVIDPSQAGRAAAGAAAVITSVVAIFFLLRWLERSGARQRLHRISQRRKFALELRVNLVVLFALAALAEYTHVSVLLAGFGYGLAVAAVGEPRRLARQLFALTEGFLGPLFFVWLGASLALDNLTKRPSTIVLGVVLGAAAVLIHVAMRITGQPVSLGGLASAQLGVPIAAATIGVQTGVLVPGEDTAIILGALVTLVAAIAAGAWSARRQAPQGQLAPPQQAARGPSQQTAQGTGT